MQTELERLVEKRDKLLEEKPHLQPLQNELNHMLDNTPNENRMDIIRIMMTTKLVELQESLLTLSKELHKCLS